LSSGRYDPDTGRYLITGDKVADTSETVIVDEASMLTEEMLAAVFDAVRAAKRVILAGDPRQLPPIGAGRPFVDIIARLRPEDADTRFPCVTQGYAELRVQRRHVHGSGLSTAEAQNATEEHTDLRLAEWFGGNPLGPGDDLVFEALRSLRRSGRVRFERWNNPEELRQVLLRVLCEELGLNGTEDVRGFELSLGGTPSGKWVYFNRRAASKAEDWQILTPTRIHFYGAQAINSLIHEVFRSERVKFAEHPNKGAQVPRPMGPERIVYGDKVINLINHERDDVYPREGALRYIANGEVGLVIGQFKSKHKTWTPWRMEVEFSTQLGFKYGFPASEFSEDAEATLSLAYALTVHKAQGSEFRRGILVLPKESSQVSRELLYTAFTRQSEKIVILYQGPAAELQRFASDAKSENAQRLTNLFVPPMLREVEGQFFEERLVNITSRNEFVRSKSELIIAERLSAAGIDYAYEKPLTLANVTLYPDFTIEDSATGKTVYWEHCGLLADPAYVARWNRKKEWYKRHGILPAEDGGGELGALIETRDNKDGGISVPEIDRVIKRFLLV
ncbi:MAG: ATP-dependent RecD-like DNA helicase, partial [Armatimonadetes bacterium]|nr:ATP-dependent RecD-like DNA helicase [Armatimonadota bacterium]